MSRRPTVSRVIRASDFQRSIDDTITLDETQRHRRRMVMVSDNGAEFLLDLEKARLLRHEDILPLSDGRHIQVWAKPEALLKVTAQSSQHLLALAWQIGNRHLAAQISGDHILIRQDHVIADMLLGLGAGVEVINAPFNPESGAYSGDTHGHSHGHNHSHQHSHD